MARKQKKGRAVNGILILNKSQGLSSNQALQKVKRLFEAKKAGHTGSLDPLATGVLPLCFGEATKFSQFLLDASKSYKTVIKLGAKTETGDREGQIIEERSVDVSEQDIKNVLTKFTGDVVQIPSMYSALKYQGQPLYKLARQGIEVERTGRTITINRLDLVDIDNIFVTLEVDCSKGTYIRTLAEDIGVELGCLAHVYELHRVQAGPYNESHMFSFEQLESIFQDKGMHGLDDLLLPVDSSITNWPSVHLDAKSQYYLMKGQVVQASNTPVSGYVSIYGKSTTVKSTTVKDKEVPIFLGMGVVDENGLVAPKRLVNH